MTFEVTSQPPPLNRDPNWTVITLTQDSDIKKLLDKVKGSTAPYLMIAIIDPNGPHGIVPETLKQDAEELQKQHRLTIEALHAPSSQGRTNKNEAQYGSIIGHLPPENAPFTARFLTATTALWISVSRPCPHARIQAKLIP